MFSQETYCSPLSLFVALLWTFSELEAALCLGPLNFMNFFWVHWSSLSRSPWRVLLPSGKSTAPLAWWFDIILKVACSFLLYMSFKILNSTVTHTDHWETALIAGFHLYIEALTEIIWKHPSNQLSSPSVKSISPMLQTESWTGPFQKPYRSLGRLHQ